MKPKKVALYLRVSTSDQDYQRQKDELVDYCRRNDYQICYIFEEKISGAKDDRIEFKKLCSLEKKDIDKVITWEYSRLGRRMSSVINAIEDFAKKGISVITLKERFESLDDNGNMTTSTLVMLGFHSSMAQIERDSIRERTLSGRRHKMMMGEINYTGHAVYGYRKNGKKLEINEDEAKVVRLVYDLCINGKSLDDIALIVGFSRAKVNNILKNEVYTGKRYSKIVGAKIDTPPIITEDIYRRSKDARQKRIRVPKKKCTNNSPLKSKMFCKECGGMLSKHGGSSVSVWGCKTGCNYISEKYMNGAIDIMLDEANQIFNSGRIKRETNDRLVNLYRESADETELVASLYQKVEDEKKKLEVLKDIFSADKLKVEVNEIKKLENEVTKHKKILDNIIDQIKIEEDSLNTGEITIESIDKIIVDKVDDFQKLVKFTIMNKDICVLVNFRYRAKPIFKLVK